MKLKTAEVDGKTYAEVIEGNPVYVHDDGKEVPFDAKSSVARISALNAESTGHRHAANQAKEALKAFEGIEDPAAAKKALETLAGLDQKKLIDAGEVEKVKAEIAKGYQEKLDAAEKRAADAEGSLYSEKIGGSFAKSKFIAEKVAIPADFVQAKFGGAYKVEEGKTVAYGPDGNKIYSRAKPGEIADFDEALEILISAHPTRDAILKGDIKGGGGAQQPNGGAGGKRTLTRAQFDALPPAEKAKAGAEATITD